MDCLIYLNEFLAKVLKQIQSEEGATEAQMYAFRKELMQWEAEQQREHMDNTSVFEGLRENILKMIYSTYLLGQ